MIEVPGHTATANQLLNGHWASRARLKKRDAALIAIACRVAKVPVAAGPRRVSLVVVMAKGQRRPDRDAWWKSLLDGLVQCQRLKDDSPKWCDLGSVEYERGDKPAMRVILEEVAA